MNNNSETVEPFGFRSKYINGLTGNLFKKGFQRKTWLSRYFVLKDSEFKYYNDDSCKQLKGTYILSNNSSVQQLNQEIDGYSLILLIKAENSTGEMHELYLSAPNENSRKNWIDTIIDTIQGFSRTIIQPDLCENFSPKVLLNIYYSFDSMNINVMDGNLLKPLQLSEKPNIDYSSPNNKFYSFFLVDMDYPAHNDEKRRNYLLWHLVNIPGSNTKSAVEVIPYQTPAPFYNSGKHRYFCLLFEQAKSFDNSTLSSIRRSTIKRDYFKLKAWLNLAPVIVKKPVGIDGFYCDWDESCDFSHRQYGLTPSQQYMSPKQQEEYSWEHSQEHYKELSDMKITKEPNSAIDRYDSSFSSDSAFRCKLDSIDEEDQIDAQLNQFPPISSPIPIKNSKKDSLTINTFNSPQKPKPVTHPHFNDSNYSIMSSLTAGSPIPGSIGPPLDGSPPRSNRGSESDYPANIVKIPVKRINSIYRPEGFRDSQEVYDLSSLSSSGTRTSLSIVSAMKRQKSVNKKKVSFSVGVMGPSYIDFNYDLDDIPDYQVVTPNGSRYSYSSDYASARSSISSTYSSQVLEYNVHVNRLLPDEPPSPPASPGFIVGPSVAKNARKPVSSATATATFAMSSGLDSNPEHREVFRRRSSASDLKENNSEKKLSRRTSDLGANGLTRKSSKSMDAADGDGSGGKLPRKNSGRLSNRMRSLSVQIPGESSKKVPLSPLIEARDSPVSPLSRKVSELKGTTEDYCKFFGITTKEVFDGEIMRKKFSKDFLAKDSYIWIEPLTKSIHWAKSAAHKYESSKHKHFLLDKTSTAELKRLTSIQNSPQSSPIPNGKFFVGQVQSSPEKDSSSPTRGNLSKQTSLASGKLVGVLDGAYLKDLTITITADNGDFLSLTLYDNKEAKQRAFDWYKVIRTLTENPDLN